MLQPIKRGRLRKYFGKKYFCYKRYFKWYFGKEKMATNRPDTSLPVTLISHKSILLRQLKAVDMYLQYNKITNLQLAANRINNLILQPNEVFSFWYLVGNTSARKGYKTGLMLDNGAITSGIGGGLCQMGNLIFWMAMHSPLTVIERWRHSYDVFPDSNRTLPFGSGATLSYNYIDLQLKNETKQPIQIKLWLDETHLNGAILAEEELAVNYKIVEKNHQFRHEHWGGYTRHNQIFKQIFDKKNGEMIKEELAVENHAVLMYQPFLK